MSKNISHDINPNRNLSLVCHAELVSASFFSGVTNNLGRRVFEHKHSLFEGFTKDYHLHTLVYYEEFTDIELAIKREKQLKQWHRQWKVNLIESLNPEWKDLSIQYFGS